LQNAGLILVLSDMSGKKPTHELCVKDLETQARGKIGVAWENDDGSFTIQLQPCTSLTYDNVKNKALTLFPIRTEAQWTKWRAENGKKESQKTAASDTE
jgi:hypothetical protein